mmetsp:Transcript_11415/g.33840  ORF Transcript_11415/g.33840 Transcript_11415/m.33840 type:complete len:781 (-) Transcript_11415:85-2427(-)
MRKLAYEYGRGLLPRLGAFEALYWALDLADPGCKAAMEASQPDDAPPAPLDPVPEDALIVDPESGQDRNAGTVEAPLRSVLAAVRLAAGRRGTVLLRGGRHHLEAALELGPEHSGLTLRSYPGEKAVLSGGKRLDVTWAPHDVANGRNVYRANVKGQVSEVPGLQVDGARATRARYPNLPGGIEVSPGYDAMIGGGEAKWTPPDFDRFGKVAFYTDETAEHLRNNTVDGWFQKYMIGVGGLCSVYDPPVGYWCSEHPSGGGAFAFRTPTGAAVPRKALPNSPYKDVSEMIMNVWRPGRWANWMFEVAHYDAATNNFTFGRGGNQGARGENTGGDFFVENVFEELDSPGEFFFNATTGDLFLFYNGTGAPPPSMDVVAPQLKMLINMTGTQWDPVRDVLIDGVEFRSTRYTYMEPHAVPSAGDWALDRISAVFLQGTENVTVRSSTFERLDGNAVMISGYNRHTRIHDNDFAYIGGNAIVSWGYTNETKNTGYPYYTPNTNYPKAGVDGTDGRHPRFNSILRNSAREVGLYEKQSSFYMQSKTAQSKISGNVFFNGPRAGINFNDGFGGGDEISDNLVFSTCRESGDHGPLNSWDRQPYLTDVRTGSPSMIMQWREIRNNFMIDNYSPQENIDNDDGSAFFRTHDNFFVYGDNGMKNDFGGHDNNQYNNVYAYVGQALGVDETLPGHEDHFYDNKVVLNGENVGGPQCPTAPGAAFTELHGNEYFTKSGKLQVCGKDLPGAQKAGIERGSTVAKTPSDDQLLTWARDVLGMREDVPEEVFV